jgi:hypothetical protein
MQNEQHEQNLPVYAGGRHELAKGRSYLARSMRGFVGTALTTVAVCDFQEGVEDVIL